MCEWCPLSLVDELGGGTTTLFVISDNPIVDIHVVYSQCTLLWQLFHIEVIVDNITVGLQPLRAFFTRREVVLTLQSLKTLNRVFKFELHLRVVRRELKADFVNEFGR